VNRVSTDSDREATHVSYFASLAPLAAGEPPWLFEVIGHTWQLRAGARGSARADSGTRLHIAAGAAIEYARLAMRSLGYAATVRLAPRPDDPALLATLTEGHAQRPTHAEDQLIAAIGPGESVDVTLELPDLRTLFATELRERVENQGCWLRVLDADDSTIREVADALADPGQHDAAGERAGDFVLLGSDRNDPQSWLRVGRALADLVLRLAVGGLVARPLRLVGEVPGAAIRLSHALGLIGCPQVLVQVDAARASGRLNRPTVSNRE
jgi:hypothetical protein